MEEEDRKRRVRERDEVMKGRSERCYVAGYEDGRRGARAKQCGQPLEARKCSDLESPEGTLSCQPLNGNPVRPRSDFEL